MTLLIYHHVFSHALALHISVVALKDKDCDWCIHWWIIFVCTYSVRLGGNGNNCSNLRLLPRRPTDNILFILGCPSVTSAAVAISLVSPRSLILKLIRRQFFSTASRRHASFRACSLLPMEYNSPSSRKIEMDWIAIFVHAARAPATVERRKT